MARFLQYRRAMRCFSRYVIAALAAITLSAETRIPEFQNEVQPGLLRVSGINATDQVYLDGELIGDGQRLTRFGNKLLVNPGDYTFAIVTEGNKLACRSHITIRENATVTARCPAPERLQDEPVY
jgi:hypothetical protein